jgi:hypothetical protein
MERAVNEATDRSSPGTYRGSARSMVMAVDGQSCRAWGYRKADPFFGMLLRGWRTALASGFLFALLIAGTPVEADEFDPLAVYEEARVLNDQWQACAASFVRERLQTRRTAERLAEQAFDQCQTVQGRLSRFLVGRVGRKSASNIMALLREKYRSGLIAAILELRARD